MTFQKSKTLKNIQKGFTLVELLVVIAVLGILATALIVVINPADKIKAGSDTVAISDVDAMAHAVETYAAQNSGVYPTACGTMETSGDIKKCPTAPTGYIETFSVTAAGGGTISVSLKSAKYTAKPVYKYDVANGKLCNVDLVATACP